MYWKINPLIEDIRSLPAKVENVHNRKISRTANGVLAQTICQ